MRLYFIRHGQSENNLLWEETGSDEGRNEDPELTAVGQKQAHLLGKFIHSKDNENHRQKNNDVARDHFQFTHLYSSLMVRSVCTATILSTEIGMPVHGWPEIHECGGIYLNDENNHPVGLPGKSRSYFAARFQNLILPDRVTDSGWYNRPFERDEERPIRARLVLDTLLKVHGNQDDRIAIVSHGGFYMELVRVMFGLQDNHSWFLMNNTGISRFDFQDDGGIRLVYHNRTDHLESRLITH